MIPLPPTTPPPAGAQTPLTDMYWELRDAKQALWVTEAKLAEANRLLEADAKIRGRVVSERDEARAEIVALRQQLAGAVEAKGEAVRGMENYKAVAHEIECELQALRREVVAQQSAPAPLKGENQDA